MARAECGVQRAVFALTWCCDGSEGIKWTLRGIRDDGSFYGEIRFQSRDADRRRASFAHGRLSTAEVSRMTELIARIREATPPATPGPHFGAFFERLSAGNAGDIRRLFEYHRGDEAHSESARAFMELIELLERHLVPFYWRIAGF
jgi:hypothetical protein